MKNYLTLFNTETNEETILDITGVDFINLGEQLDKLPKNKEGKNVFGDILIHQWGGEVKKQSS